MIESEDGEGRRWTTIGVSPNIIDAAYNALYDAITYSVPRYAGVAATASP